MITFMELHEKLMECAKLSANTPSKDHHVVVTAIHQTLAHIPDWLDKDCIDPMDPLMTVYENYDSIMLKKVNQQYFTIGVINRAGKELEVTLPTLVVEKGIKWYKENAMPTMSKEFLKEELRRVVNMMQDPDHFSKRECIETLHSVLEQIPEWKDASVLPPYCPLLTIYGNYDEVLIGSLNDQFFTLVYYVKPGDIVYGEDGTPMFKNGACCALPYTIAETGVKKYFNDINTVEVTEPERPYPKSPVFNPSKVRLGFKKLDPRAIMPRYAHVGDAGMDVFALDDVTLPLHAATMVHTGIAAEIPEGYEIQVRARSGLATKGVTVWNAPGTIDSKYRGEICVILMFLSNHLVVSGDNEDPHANSYQIQSGDRIAQLVLAPVTEAEPYEVQELSTTDRGTGGFGSTGR